MDAMPVHRDEQAFRHILHDAHGLKFGANRYPVDGACHHRTQVGDFDFSGPAPVPVQA